MTLDHLSKVVGWRGLAQRDPLNEYKQEAFELFQTLLTSLRELVTTQLSHVDIQMRAARRRRLRPTSASSAKSTSIRRPARTTPRAT